MNQRTALRFRVTWRRRLALSVPLLVALGSAILVIIGSTGPWARVPGYSSVYGNGGGDFGVFWVQGTEVTGMIPLMGDGMLLLILGSIAGGLILWRRARPNSSAFLLLTVFILLLVSGTIGAVDWANAETIPRADPTVFFSGDVEVAWGLMMTALAAWPGVASTAYQLWKDELQ